MKLSEYAKRIGVTRHTATNWFHKGLIPGAYQMSTGTIIVPNDIFSKVKTMKRKTIIYARVSSSEQKYTNLETQAERLVKYAIANGYTIDKVVKEVGSGLNDKRTKLTNILMEENIERIIVEHKDRLTRFGFNFIKILAKNKVLK